MASSSRIDVYPLLVSSSEFPWRRKNVLSKDEETPLRNDAGRRSFIGNSAVMERAYFAGLGVLLVFFCLDLDNT